MKPIEHSTRKAFLVGGEQDNREKSVHDEIFFLNAKVHLVIPDEKRDTETVAFSSADRIALFTLLSLPEASLGSKRIVDYFAPAFFRTNFWDMWCTTFAFHPWHSLVEFKRYCLRFLQELYRVNGLNGLRVSRTQQKSITALHKVMEYSDGIWRNQNGVSSGITR